MTSRVALVTGGTGGIGTAIVRKLAAMGHKVATNYRDKARVTPDVKEQLVAASAEVSAGRPVSDWVQWRDEQLVDVLKLQHATESTEPRES